MSRAFLLPLLLFVIVVSFAPTSDAQVNGRRNACIYNPLYGCYYLEKNRDTRRNIRTVDTWAPDKGQVSRTGDCNVLLDASCRVVGVPGGCNQTECVLGTCIWYGGNSRRTAPCFSRKCFYAGGTCRYTNLPDDSFCSTCNAYDCVCKSGACVPLNYNPS